MLGGVVLVLLLMLLTVRAAGKALELAPHSNALPDLTLSVTRELTQRLVDDALHDIKLPLVTVRDPYVQLEPGGVVVLQLRGDTALLGAQTIVLRLRVEPAGSGVRVASELATVQGLGSVPAALTDRLDQAINAQLSNQLSFAEGWEVLSVGGDEQAIEVRARLL